MCKRMLALIFVLILFISKTQAQKDIQNIIKTSNTVGLISEKFYLLYDISVYFYKTGNSDSMLIYSKALITTAQYLKNDSFLIVSYRILGNCYYLKNDYVTAIEYYFNGITLAEHNEKMIAQLPQLYNNIGYNYNKLGYFESALKYLEKAKHIASESMNNLTFPYIYENLAETFLGKNKPDSSLYYLNLALEANAKVKDQYIQASILLDIGKTYAQFFYDDLSPKQSKLAETYFIKAILFSDSTHDSKHFANSNCEYAVYFFKSGKLDSSKIYAQKSLLVSNAFYYYDNIIKNAGLLCKIYDSEGNISEAYKYLKIRIDKSDSLQELNKENQLLALTFNASLREKENEAKKIQDKEQRKKIIEFSLIAISLITLTIIFLLVSQTFIVDAKFINFFGRIGLLIVFEFINLVFHPFIENITHHSTVLMLLIMVLLAIGLIPLHHKLEKYVTIKLVAKNDRIRESKAKKILKQLNKKRPQ